MIEIRPAFQEPVLWAQFSRALRAWIGTPYRHLCMVRGRGADCTLFVGGVLLECGILRRVEYDYYAKDWYESADRDMLVENLYSHFQRHRAPGYTIEKLPPDVALLRGDVLGFSTRRPGITNHVGVLVAPRLMIHCVERRGVSEFEYGDCWSRRLSHVFRIMKEGQQ